MALYKGYSSKNYINNDTFSLTDIKLVNEDLLNHIWTRKGERVHMPTFGTSIPDLVFEPLDEFTISQVKNDLMEVVNYDPRVELIDLSVQPYYEKYTLLAKIDLYYIELDDTGGLTLKLDFGNNT